ncbi:hypothetical protein ColLi_06522 [Colletotrichum liriopes]|uniref:Uncharacterized protein n=1 Tax=Colletotrichum liriopes TaxID=708192 RepID=A0AA37GMC0_9PEZI|nr:hypothetical protein ColLi_06522 [Colletotrichum liriopes]
MSYRYAACLAKRRPAVETTTSRTAVGLVKGKVGPEGATAAWESVAAGGGCPRGRAFHVTEVASLLGNDANALPISVWSAILHQNPWIRDLEGLGIWRSHG